ncbi:hypothetical protein BDW75DRAFT_45330 [Aspergillus navahoensis]
MAAANSIVRAGYAPYTDPGRYQLQEDRLPQKDEFSMRPSRRGIVLRQDLLVHQRLAPPHPKGSSFPPPTGFRHHPIPVSLTRSGSFLPLQPGPPVAEDPHLVGCINNIPLSAAGAQEHRGPDEFDLSMDKQDSSSVPLARSPPSKSPARNSTYQNGNPPISLRSTRVSKAGLTLVHNTL